jgi:hypothetical protein
MSRIKHIRKTSDIITLHQLIRRNTHQDPDNQSEPTCKQSVRLHGTQHHYISTTIFPRSTGHLCPLLLCLGQRGNRINESLSIGFELLLLVPSSFDWLPREQDCGEPVKQRKTVDLYHCYKKSSITGCIPGSIWTFWPCLAFESPTDPVDTSVQAALVPHPTMEQEESSDITFMVM